MLRRKELKKRGLSAFYRNWKSCIIVCFVYAVFIGGTIISINREFDFNYDYKRPLKTLNLSALEGQTNSDIVNEFINGLTGSKPIESEFLSNATRGVLGTISNNVSKTGSFLFGLLNAINELLFKDRIWPSVVIIIGALLSLVYWIFVSKVLEVGKNRFFLENNRYTKTKVSKILLPYKINKVTNIAYTMFLKNMYTILWSFTIVGGFIKYYAYKMVPYILAENPSIKPQDALKLSEDMMDGYKWELFKLDLSFIGYFFLGILTFNISNLVFFKPYEYATYTEVYLYLRDLSKTRGLKNNELLKDNELDGDIVFGEYPIPNNMLKTSKRKWLNYNYNRKYTLVDLLILFVLISMLGWIWEELLHLFQTGEFVKRGTLQGPWLPIYGGGCVALLVLLKKFRDNPFVYFTLSMVVCGIIEYATSIYLEVVHHMAWWNYEGFFLNLNGRICLEGLILFGIGGVIATYFLAPIIIDFINKAGKKLKLIFCIFLTLAISFDFYYSTFHPNVGAGITEEITEKK